MKKRITFKQLLFGAFVVILITVVVVFAQSDKANQSNGKKVTVYKSPTCGCCVNYVSYLKSKGYDVDLISTNDLDVIKTEHNIPASMQSCHTMIIDDYFVEGHVPLAAVDKLLTEKPSIDGIALPAMPAGSPGMPGIKLEPFEIFSLSNGQISEFTSL